MSSCLHCGTTTPTRGAKFDPKSKVDQIYNYYDSRYRDDAFESDVYSPEWHNRIENWCGERLHEENSSGKVDSVQSLERFSLGRFFFDYPVEAFALWKLLKATYALDNVVCHKNTNPYRWARIEKCPFEYLGDQRILDDWRKHLQAIKREIKCQDEDSGWERQFEDILKGVERIHDSLDMLTRVFDTEREIQDEFAEEIMKRIERNVGRRFDLLNQVLTFGEHELEELEN